jgi:hypothetical protein
MHELLPFVLLLGVVVLLIGVAVVLCITADRFQLAMSYRAAQRRFRSYRSSQSQDFPGLTQVLLSDPVLRSARDLEVMYPPGIEPDDPAYYRVAHFVPPHGGFLYSTRRLQKLGLVPFARADSIVLYCAPLDTRDLRMWFYDTKSRRAHPTEIEYPKLLSDLRATLSA